MKGSVIKTNFHLILSTMSWCKEIALFDMFKRVIVLFPGYPPSPYWSPYWICTQLSIHEINALREVLWQRVGKFLLKITIALSPIKLWPLALFVTEHIPKSIKVNLHVHAWLTYAKGNCKSQTWQKIVHSDEKMLNHHGESLFTGLQNELGWQNMYWHKIRVKRKLWTMPK